MKKVLLILSNIILSINCYAQNAYEKGYYISNSNEKVNCLIQNIGWNNNPSEFEYKLTENSEKKIATISSVKEFGIYNVCKYSRQIVEIDKSSNNLEELSSQREPILEEKEIFLQVLVEGKANLYVYKNLNSNRYFYNKDNIEINQLIFKKYLIEGNRIVENNKFRQQLWDDMKCPNFTISRLQNVDYNQTDLINFFIEYNKCNNQEFVNFEKQDKRDLFNLNIRPGINISSLSIENFISQSTNVDFGTKMSLRFGVEAEIIFPFYRNKWALIIEPTYQYFRTEKDITAYQVTQNVKADYVSIELPIGIRHYLFLNDNSKIFFNASFISNFHKDSVIDYETSSDLEIETSSNIALGCGYKYNDKFSFEFRYHTKRNLLKNRTYWKSDYKTVSIILGYTLF